ncbi:hypothetical protein OBRU01_19391 [Operophtera brumata]|uniref:Secreted protein n=1 Tax=Operophtera brumata TaxID=104452 RepID=A0A0L7KWT1_OPEBR|nr:hypothetical protein OBRU01_19391 [Operophtera brumata]
MMAMLWMPLRVAAVEGCVVGNPVVGLQAGFPWESTTASSVTTPIWREKNKVLTAARHHEDPGPRRARARALPAHARAARAHLLDGRAPRLRPQAGGPSLQRIRFT